MKHQTWKTLITCGLTLIAVVACGGNPIDRKTDPMRDYPDLKGDVAPSNYQGGQKIFDSVLFSIEVENQVGNPNLELFEGKQSTFSIIAIHRIPGLNVRLTAEGLPPGASLNAQSPGVYQLKWTPAIGLIPPNSQRKIFPISLTLEIDDNSLARARQIAELDLQRRNRTKTFNLNVNFSDAEPQIKVTGLKENYKMGEVLPFQVTVTDPTATKERRPDVSITYDEASFSGEMKTFPVSNAAIPDPSKNNQFLGGGKWVFHYLFDTTTIHAAYLKPSNGYKGGQMVIKALNQSSRLMSSVLKNVKIEVPESAQTATPQASAQTQAPAKPATVTAQSGAPAQTGAAAQGSAAQQGDKK